MTKHLYIDYSHTCFRVLFAIRAQLGKIDDIQILRHVILKNIFHLIEKFNPTDVVIACDNQKSWRKKLYEGYKGQRKEQREKDDFDWDEFFKFINELTEELKLNFPFKVLNIPFLEADDIIAYLVRANENVDKVMVTSDGDYVQLLRYPNTEMYDPIKHSIITKKPHEADYALQIKILIGDKSDNIPAVQPRLGIKTAEKLIESGEIDKRMEEELFKKNYEFNSKLVDLTKTPKALTQLLETQIAEYSLAGTSNIFNYFVDKGLRDFLARSNDICNMLKPIAVKKAVSVNSEVLFSQD
jgi:5'-3' exonuclease